MQLIAVLVKGSYSKSSLKKSKTHNLRNVYIKYLHKMCTQYMYIKYVDKICTQNTYIKHAQKI